MISSRRWPWPLHTQCFYTWPGERRDQNQRGRDGLMADRFNLIHSTTISFPMYIHSTYPRGVCLTSFSFKSAKDEQNSSDMEAFLLPGQIQYKPTKYITSLAVSKQRDSYLRFLFKLALKPGVRSSFSTLGLCCCCICSCHCS